MNYEVNETTQEVTGSLRMPIGVLEDAELIGVSFETLTEGRDPVLTVTFGDGAGGEMREVIWEVDEQQVRQMATENPRTHSRDVKSKGFVKGAEITADEAVQIEMDTFKQKVKHIATKYVSEEELTEATRGVTSYAEFSRAYAALFTEEAIAAGNPVRLKVVPNKQGYATLPRYTPFIESMSVPKEKSKLQMTEYEKNLIAQTDESASADDPLGEDFDTDIDLDGEVAF